MQARDEALRVGLGVFPYLALWEEDERNRDFSPTIDDITVSPD
jgi:hypothetical protein